jgi:hypothetical protein
VCEACFTSDDTPNVIARKVMGVIDLKISEGGEASREQVRNIAAALSERQDATEH